MHPNELEQLRARDTRTLSVVVPVFNEQEVLPEFHARLSAVLDGLALPAKIIYVNDGSIDATLDAIRQLAEHDARVMLVDLSRNFGKEIALTAGLDHADTDAVVVIDADLQDPPELIPELVAHWLDGYDVVYAKRTCRNGESAAKRLTAFLFYRLIQKMSRVRIPEDTGDFRLLSRRAVHAVCQMREQHRFMKGMFAWIGYPQKAVPYQRAPRHAGASKWNYWKLWNFALEGITSFSCMPLKVATYVGLCSASGAFAYGLYIVVRTLVVGNPVPGYPSLLTAIMFLGGLQLSSIGIIGEYLARMFDESKQRPLYFLKDGVPCSTVCPPERQTGHAGRFSYCGEEADQSSFQA
ncbi:MULTISPECIES: glycosyltransferase family 2 protein [unclassified Massilia]|uniref:glycosyltransferase family 2 protein n=1 Tax=unclassified Massilia TaxID=2609279 RepID=UPI0009E7D70C|nr:MULTISPECIES: glycosyltransferase family 2 protein [unclassified Massilia]